MEHIILDNGLNILFRQMLNTHSAAIGLYIKAGSGYENERQNGITHFLEHLHFRRLGEISQEELYYKMESMGSDLRGITYRDFLKFSMKVTPDQIQKSLFLFKNIIEADEWTEEEFLKEKQVVINQIIEKENYIWIEDEVGKTIFGNSPLANRIIGTVENIQNMQMAEILKYKKQMFNRDNLIFCITGHIDDETWLMIQRELQTLHIPKGEQMKWLPVPDGFHCRKPDVSFLTTKNSLLDVNLSFDISGAEQMGNLLLILNCILGEGTGSNLQKRVRENLGYTSDIYSYLERYKGFAVLHIRFSVERKLLIQCLTEIIQVIGQTKAEITIKDLDVSLPFYTTNKIFLEDDPLEMNHQIAYDTFILEDKSDDLPHGKQILTKLEELAKIIFVPQNACLVVEGNTNGISKRSIRNIIDKLA